MLGPMGYQEGRLGGTGLDLAVMAVPLSHPDRRKPFEYHLYPLYHLD